MDRRSFLASLLATATLDPGRLLWVPGQKLISIPRPGFTSGMELIKNQLWFGPKSSEWNPDKKLVSCVGTLANGETYLFWIPRGEADLLPWR